MFKEKRKEKRVNINIPIRFKHLDNDSIYQTIMHNISNGGMRIMSKVNINNNQKISFNLSLSQNNSIVAAGHIIWTKPHRYGNGFYEVGVKFNGLEKNYKTSINNFIKKHNLASS